MSTLRRNWQYGALGLGGIVAIGLLVLSVARTSAQAIVPIVISVVSLVISLVSAFRSVFFPFRLKLAPGGLYSVQRSTTSTELSPAVPDDLDLILPMVFVNVGYGDGIIEGIAVKVFGDTGTTMLYRPTAEIDMKTFVQGFSVPGKANIVGIFMPFPLHAKEYVQKVWLFSQDTRQNPYPRAGWRPGTYQFEYFVKHARWTQPKRFATMEQVIDDAHIETGRKGVAMALPVASITP